jgi:hypothetical protein
MTNNVSTVRNVFCPYKDYSSFLGSKLTMLAKLSRVIFGIVSAYFIIYEAYFVVDKIL